MGEEDAAGLRNQKAALGVLVADLEVEFFLSSRLLGFWVHHPFQGPLTHLCDLEAGYGGVWAPNFGGAAPGFEPWTSCLRVRNVTITLQGLPT